VHTPGITDRIGILLALRQEEARFERVVAQARSYTRRQCGMGIRRLGNVEIAVGVSGVGRKLCQEAAERMIDCGVTSLICAGVSAGLDMHAHVGDVYVADTLCLLESPWEPWMRSSPQLMSIVPPTGPNGTRIRRCSAVTSDRIIISVEEKHHILRSTGAAILDMESYAAAEVCARRDIPFAAVRCVSDTATESLPKEIPALAALPDKTSRCLYTIIRPRLWPALARLNRNVGVASENLADTLGMMLLRLV